MQKPKVEDLRLAKWRDCPRTHSTGKLNVPGATAERYGQMRRVGLHAELPLRRERHSWYHGRLATNTRDEGTRTGVSAEYAA